MRHKYNAVRTEVDGITFDSKAEAVRYQELRLLELAKEVRNIRLQPAFVLTTVTPDGEVVPVCVARMDFEYEEFHYSTSSNCAQCWHRVIEDRKGYDTAVSKLKRKWVERQYGITVRLT
jgi:hypothetical protein